MKEGQHNTASKSMAVEPGGLGLNHSSPITSEVSMAKSLNLSGPGGLTKIDKFRQDDLEVLIQISKTLF